MATDGSTACAPSAMPEEDDHGLVCRVSCLSVELKLTLGPKLLARPFVDAVVTPFLKAYNNKNPGDPPLMVGQLRRVQIDGTTVARLEDPASGLLKGELPRVVLVPPTRRDKLVINSDEEWGSDEEPYDIMGQKMHRRNLRTLTAFLHRPGLWRVRLSQVFEILEVVQGGAKGGPPQPSEFSLKVERDGQPPSCGTLTRLSDKGGEYVRHLVTDLQKVARAKDLAHEDAVATQDNSRGNKHVMEMTQAVGALPPSRAEIAEEARQRSEAEALRRAEERERDQRELHEELGQLSMEEELRKAQRKAAKRARQKARQRELKAAALSEQATTDTLAVPLS